MKRLSADSVNFVSQSRHWMVDEDMRQHRGINWSSDTFLVDRRQAYGVVTVAVAVGGDNQMKTISAFLHRFAADESGATMVEYTILIGLITVVAIALIAAVGSWVQNAWT